jgi:PAS domain S-box-containing protein
MTGSKFNSQTANGIQGSIFQSLTDISISDPDAERTLYTPVRVNGSDINSENIYSDTEANSEHILQSINAGIWVINENGTTRYINEQLVKLLGYAEKEILNRSIFDFLDDDGTWLLSEKLRKCREGNADQFEFRFVKKSGAVIWILFGISPLFENKVFKGWTALLFDITKRKLADQENQKSLDRFNLAVQATHDGIWEWNIETDDFYYSPGWCAINGYSKDDPELLRPRASWLERIHPDHVQYVNLRIDLHLSRGIPFEVVYQHKHRSGQYRWQKATGQATFSNDGQPLTMVGSIADITQQKLVEEQIIREKHLSDSIVNSLPGIFYILNRSGKLLRHNKNLDALLYPSEKKNSSIDLLDYIKEEDKIPVREAFLDVYEKGSSTVEGHIITATGEELPYYFTGVHITYNGEPCVIGMGVNVSELRRAKDMLNNSLSDIRALASHLQDIREEERNSIAREIHDELGQMLTAVKMDLSKLNRTPASAEGTKGRIKESLNLIDQTIASVRKIASSLRPRIIDDMGFTAAIEWYVKDFQSRTEIHTEFINECPNLVLKPRAAIALFRITQESLTNVARHAHAHNIEVALRYEHNCLHLTINDDGKGFDIEQTKKKKTLGLLGLKERTQTIGGSYEISSVPGQGTRVDIRVRIDENQIQLC